VGAIMKFHERFDIPIDLDRARNNFLNRVHNLLFHDHVWKLPSDTTKLDVYKNIINVLGRRYNTSVAYPYLNLSNEVGNDFYDVLMAIEGLYATSPYKENINQIVSKLIMNTEFDLGIKWDNGHFTKTGAKILDDKLVNDPLRWLREKKYQTVLEPFEKGLRHFLESDKRPEVLSDVITDMYEALEALSMIYTEKKDLSGSYQQFLSMIKAADEYKALLRCYIEYSNNFRHAVKEGKSKPTLSSREVESFIYLTGTFIRLAME
jgi:hypothetical protein